MAVRTIIKEGKGVRYERLAASTISPGHLIGLTAADKFEPHGTAAGKAAPLFAIENEIFGRGPDIDYDMDDRVLAEWCHPGMQVNAVFGAGAHSIVVGDLLESNGDGTLRKMAGNAVGVAIGAVIDSDDAETDGTDLYLHLDENSWFGLPCAHLETVAAGNANTAFRLGATGPLVRVKDDDAAASGGLVVYFDEDADSPDERFLINNSLTGTDVFVFTSNGSAIRFVHDANASVKGVSVHIDDNGANAHERLLFVSPTNEDGEFATDDEINLTTAPNYPLAVAMENVGVLAAAAHYRVAIL